jgi:peptidase C39-like protein
VQTLRFASANVATRHPLVISGAAAWRRSEGAWSCTIDLRDLPNDHIVVPSFARLGQPHSDFAAELVAADAAWRIAPTQRTALEANGTDPRATTHIDYFHCRADVAAVSLMLSTAAAQEPADYLISVSTREFRIAAAAGSAVTRRLVVPPISQMTAPRALRYRICSPTCIAMVLAYHGIDAPLAAVVRECLHEPSGLFGVWPLAIRTATDAGLIGNVECFSDLDAAAPVLDRGLPIVASIRFAAGALPGAALSGTDGHLVVVTGMDADWVYINDPAARDASGVPRQCPRDAFAAAWLTERGAAYILRPL